MLHKEFHCEELSIKISAKKQTPPLDLRNGVSIHQCIIHPSIEGLPSGRQSLTHAIGLITF